MKRKGNTIITINSISELYKLAELPKPKHPLVGLIRLDDVSAPIDGSISLVLNLYTISLKRCIESKLKYGQNYYDFDEGVLAFMEPGQVISNGGDNYQAKGWWLVFHPDLIRNYPLMKSIKNYGFFSYAVNEALHLSEEEELMMETLFKNIEAEYNHSIDQYSQDVLVAQLELLLNYSNRFYNRQFITRKTAHHDLLSKVESLLDDYFNSNQMVEQGLPSVQYFSERLNVSPNYLSDLLRSHTGQSTQQHIHNRMIEKAKEALTTTHLSISEIAYQLGFEHPQSFSKFFKSKTTVSPLEYRASFN